MNFSEKRRFVEAMKQVKCDPALRRAMKFSLMNDLSAGYEPEPDHELTEEQMLVLECFVKAGCSLCLVGKPGTGKSFVLKRIVDMLPGEFTFVTAPTHEAAANVGGVTIKSLAVGVFKKKKRDSTADEIAASMAGGNARTMWEKMKYLIVDESSGLSACMLEGLDRGARQIRGNSEFFGGIQLLLVGDPGQIGADSYHGTSKQKLFFECPSFDKKLPIQMQLTHSFRQKKETDADFLRVLDDVRSGKPLSPETTKLLTARQWNQKGIDVLCHEDNPIRFNGCSCLGCKDGIQATRFVLTHIQAQKLNDDGLKRCIEAGGEAYQFQSADNTDYCSAENDDGQVLHSSPWDLLDHNVQSTSKPIRGKQLEKKLELALGAQVVLRISISERLKKGSRGIIRGWVPVKLTAEDRIMYKTVGEAWSAVADDCGFHIWQQDEETGKPIDFANWFSDRSNRGGDGNDDNDDWIVYIPKVLFACGVEEDILPRRIFVRRGKVLAHRDQLPLQLAYAATIDSSQVCS